MSGPINKRASFFLDYNERDITNNAITNAIFLDPTTLAAAPVNTAVVTPQMNRTISPRIDYQLTTNNTLTGAFEERMSYLNNAGLGGYHLPPPYSSLAYNTSGDAQNLMLTETAILNPHIENETRFQYYRNWSQSSGNDIPQVNVANSFITGGNGSRQYVRPHASLRAAELHHRQPEGRTPSSFGVRARRDSDQSNNPQGFNGQFTFLGGEEPVLDAPTRSSPIRTATRRRSCSPRSSNTSGT